MKNSLNIRFLTKRRSTTWVVGSLLVLCLIVVIFAARKERPAPDVQQGDRIIRYTKRGFTPQEITVRVGQRVVFQNDSPQAFWPASNPHPVHSVYPAFDPKIPVAPGKSWSFVFDQAGNWNFHDHIQPSFFGKITVLPPGKNAPDANQCEHPERLEYTRKEQCWEELITRKIKKGDIKGAFEQFAHFYRTDKDFSIGCHYRAHLVGDAFYTYLVRRSSIDAYDLPPETVYCGYGFYHGIFEHMIRDEGTSFRSESVYRLCDMLDKKYGKTIPLMRINCFHGAGHGIMPDPPDTKLWGNADAIIQKPQAICDGISRDPGEIEQCYEGIYNVIVDWTWRNQYGFSPDTDNPMGLCARQKEAYQKSCYYEFIMRLGDWEGGDIVRLSKRFIDPIGPDVLAQLMTESLVAAKMSVSVVDTNQLPYLYACRRVAVRLRESCLAGVLFGFRAHGDPGIEYKKALTFCASAELTSAEKTICYRELVTNNRYIYDERKVQQICREFEEGFRQSCNQAKQ